MGSLIPSRVDRFTRNAEQRGRHCTGVHFWLVFGRSKDTETIGPSFTSNAFETS